MNISEHDKRNKDFVQYLRKELAAMGVYTITLTGEDCKAIRSLAHAYEWAAELSGSVPGTHALTECEAWALMDAVDADTVGRHSILPGLNPASNLYAQIVRLREEVV